MGSNMLIQQGESLSFWIRIVNLVQFKPNIKTMFYMVKRFAHKSSSGCFFFAKLKNREREWARARPSRRDQLRNEAKDFEKVSWLRFFTTRAYSLYRVLTTSSDHIIDGNLWRLEEDQDA